MLVLVLLGTVLPNIFIKLSVILQIFFEQVFPLVVTVMLQEELFLFCPALGTTLFEILTKSSSRLLLCGFVYQVHCNTLRGGLNGNMLKDVF